MRRLAVTLAALPLLACAGPAAGAGGPPQIPRIPGKWSHVELNVVIKKVPHTLILDHGKVAEITTTSVTLREAGGVTPTIPLTDQTIVTLDGRRGSVSSLRRRMTVTVLRVDGGAAVRVRATTV
ncbi:MAG: hypothetical protein ACJ77E_08245 [Gaiellaceae bacterium]